MTKRRMSTRLSVTYVILIFLMVGTASFVFYKYNKTRIYDEGVDHLGQMAEITMEQIDTTLTALDQTAIEVLTHVDFMDYWTAYTESPEDEILRNIKRILTDSYKNKSTIRRIAVYDKEGNYVSTGNVEITGDAVKERAVQIENKYNFEKNFQKGLNRVFWGAEEDFWESSSGGMVNTELKPIKNQKNEVVGYIEVQQNYFYVRDICEVKWGKTALNTLIVLGESDEVLYQTVRWEDDKITSELVEMTDQYVKIRENEDFLIAMASSNYYDCRTVIALEKKILYKSMGSVIRGIAGISSAAMLLTVLYVILVTKRIMRPINTFIKHMQEVRLENFATHHTGKYMDLETEILVNSYEEMTGRLKESMEKQHQMEEVQTKTLFSILQSEISPHFLYNTLGSIANMCESNENEKAADACYSLTEIIRYSSNYATSEVTVSEEVENMRSYFAIMKSRYRQRLEYELQMDEEVNYVMLPKLTLQPIVENAIKFSLLERDTVVIKVYIIYFDGYMIVEIKDNGCGIEKEDVQKVEQRIKEFKDTDGAEEIINNIQIGGMGLSGTLIRLSIFFGDDFSYQLLGENDEGGTTVVLRMKVEE